MNMDFLQLVSAEYASAVYEYLAHSVVFHVVVFLCLIRLYCRLTVGMCNSHQDMAGKTVLITGATSGIGKATAFDLARRNARVILACRNPEKAEMVSKEIISLTGNCNVEIKQLDLCSFDSVKECAKDVLRTEKQLHVLINNAGIGGNKVKITKDGCEKIMQSNHLGHFLLTLMLLDLLKKSAPSRIINVSSLMYIWGHLNVEDMNGANESYWKSAIFNLYNRSKLANILFTRELSSRLAGTGVTVNAAHPGAVKTEFLSNMRNRGAFILLQILVQFLGKSALEGAQTSIYLAVHPELERTTGKFFHGCKERTLWGKARDKELAKRLFEASGKIVGTMY